jgi:hypothetical protein
MNQNFLRHTLSAFVLLLAIGACVLPGQAPRSVPAPNSINIETAVAGTAQVAATQTILANPISATASLIPTESPTSTPQVSVSGTSLIVREDQSTLFIDYKAGVELVVPAGWMAVRIGEAEYLKAFSSDVTLQNPAIQDVLTVIRDADPETFRLSAIDIHPEHIPNGKLTTLNVVFESGDTRSLKEWEQAEKNRYNPYAGYKFIAATYPQTNNGTQVLVIEKSYAAKDGGTVYYRGVFFALPSGGYVLDFYTNFEYKDEMMVEFDQVVNSVTPLNP